LDFSSESSVPSLRKPGPKSIVPKLRGEASATVWTKTAAANLPEQGSGNGVANNADRL